MKPPVPSTDPTEDDWRLHATARLAENWTSPWTGQNVPKGSRLTVSSVIQLTKKKQLTIPLPNATALLLNSSAAAYRAAKELRDRNKLDKSLQADVSFQSDQEAFDYIERMIESIIMAFTAIEAFVNETIPEDYVYAHRVRSDIVLETSYKPDIERHVSIDEKLTAVLPEVLKCASPKGSRCWQNYRHLKITRDRIIHMKTQDRRSSGADVETLWKAIFLCPAPHLAANAVIDHFIKSMETKPGWHTRFPHAKA
jgi:hypothetical protein